MELPLFGKIKLYQTSKAELLDLWKTVLTKNNITVNENCRVESITTENGIHTVRTMKGDLYTAAYVLLAIGRRGTPRKLNIPGEMQEKVAYRLVEPEAVTKSNIIVVGGGDSAVESALLLKDDNHVMLSYRGEAFSRIKTLNNKALNDAVAAGKIDVRLNSNLLEIGQDYVKIAMANEAEPQLLKNDMVYIFAGGELPTQFLEKAGIKITRKFGETVRKH